MSDIFSVHHPSYHLEEGATTRDPGLSKTLAKSQAMAFMDGRDNRMVGMKI
jgi:hypothetical protein